MAAPPMARLAPGQPCPPPAGWRWAAAAELRALMTGARMPAAAHYYGQAGWDGYGHASPGR